MLVPILLASSKEEGLINFSPSVFLEGKDNMSYKKITLANFDNHRNTTSVKEFTYAKEYRNMPTDKRWQKAALKASNNGECWWVYKWIMYNR